MLIATRTLRQKLLSIAVIGTLAGIAGHCSSGPAQTTVAAPNAPLDTLPTIGLTANTLTFMATAGGSSPPAQTVMVMDSGGGTLSGLAIGAIGYVASPTGWLAASASPPGAIATSASRKNSIGARAISAPLFRAAEGPIFRGSLIIRTL